MSAVYRIFTISNKVEEGARVELFSMSGAGVSIPAILVGERGRGRELGVLPVGEPVSGERILFAEIGQTRAGRPKLFEKPVPNTDDEIIVVMRTGIGYRGGNSHTGDRVGWKCRKFGCPGAGGLPVPEVCGVCGASDYEAPRILFADFPGVVLVKGIIADGDAGRMGSGAQFVALLKKGEIFRAATFGRQSGSMYYVWNGERLLAATWSERELADLF